MAETMEQYMSKTQTDYGSGVARPEIEEKDSFKLKGQFLKELRENTFSSSDNEDANEHIEKVLKIIDLFHVPNITADQLMLRVFLISLTRAARREIKKVNEKVYDAQVGCEQCKEPHYTKDCLLKEEGKTLKKAYYTQFGGPFQGGGYRATSLEYYQRKNANPSYQERRQSMEDTLSKYMGASVSVMPLLTYLNLGLGELAHTRLTVELADKTMKYPKGIAKNVLVGIGKFTFPVDFIILDIPEDIKVPLILGRPFLSTARSKIYVYKRKITLRVEEEKIIFKSVKPASNLIMRVYMLCLRERMELDLEARLMGETLVLNRSLDLFLEDYIKLNDLIEPIKIRRNQRDDLMPTIEEGEVIEEFRLRDKYLDTGIDDYPSYCDDDKKIYIDFLENIDVNRDEGMGDVIVGEPFLRELGIKAKMMRKQLTKWCDHI
ncbi:putative reverse transcriptase domain-containing protein [Tanacetum coccineum]